MTDPTPQEGYTWPVGPEQRPTGPQAPPRPGPTAVLTRGQGAVTGAVYGLVSVGAGAVTGLSVSVGLIAPAVGVGASAAATALPRLRAFAQGFLVASILAGIGGVAAVLLFMALIFTAATL